MLFPVLYLGSVLRKRDFKAFAGRVTGSVVAAIVFGPAGECAFGNQILFWALRGEGLNPYDISRWVSYHVVASAFHLRAAREPHPFLHAPRIFAGLLLVLQTLLIAPALLLGEPDNHGVPECSWNGPPCCLAAWLSLHALAPAGVFYVARSRGARRLSRNRGTPLSPCGNWLSWMEGDRGGVAVGAGTSGSATRTTAKTNRLTSADRNNVESTWASIQRPWSMPATAGWLSGLLGSVVAASRNKHNSALQLPGWGSLTRPTMSLTCHGFVIS
jgi:hypothetical protein